MPAASVVLADANSFFASCERVFHPDLQGKPIVVLSNNDGCVVARSAEAKRLGVPMGAPWFKIKEKARRLRVVARSSNYELYASLSTRMMSIMTDFLPGQEVYSIDESFLTSPYDNATTREVCLAMKEAIFKGIGVPVSIGIAPTKTLAKVVNHWSKDHPDTQGVLSWSQVDPSILEQVPVTALWGVGRRLGPQLISQGILTAADLARADTVAMRRRFSLPLERTILELRGTPCIVEDDEGDANHGIRREQILCSRMFSHPIQGYETLCQAVSVYAQKATRRLKRQGSLCYLVSVFCSTSRFREQERSRVWSTQTLDSPSDSPLVISKAACQAIHGRIDPHAPYNRAGVVLQGLTDADSFITLDGLEAHRDDQGLGEILESAITRFGPMTVGIGYGGIRGKGLKSNDTGADWSMKRQMLSERSTTRWKEMPVVKAK